ncbi:MAG: family 10 glycosylhydrolase, partial [Prevotella sp.]|nr:family 10 glycosylhydrolase [Prevotella sp.]
MNHKPAFNVFSHIRSHAAAAFLVLAAALNVTSTYAQNNAFSVKPPKHELRGVWLTTVRGLDWPKTYSVDEASRLQQQQELINILDQLQRANVNTVLLQTRVRATALFASEYEPWAQCLSGEGGVSPGYDALQFAIDECHKRGMEIHAWMVALPVGKWDDVGCQTLRRNYPSLVRKIGTLGFLSPEAEGTADYLATICREVTRKYDIDGIHLDYMRYPDEWKITVSREKGRRNITRIVEAVSKAVKAEKPWVKMSCSPVGKYSDLSRYSSRNWNARDKVCQEAQVWLRRGLMDQLYPMQYF